MVTRMLGGNIVLQGELSKRTLKIMDDIVELAPYRDQVVNKKNPDPEEVRKVAQMYFDKGLGYIANSLLRMIGDATVEPETNSVTEEEIVEFIRQKPMFKPIHICNHFGVHRSKVDHTLQRLVKDGIVDHKSAKYWVTGEIEGIIER